ncbi:MAG: Zn-dependent protease [Thermoanaerobacter sp.]|nr:Zn-dependent protease [Thermoanaerobacter sp.]
MIHYIYLDGIDALKELNWEAFLNNYLEKNRLVIKEYCNNFFFTKEVPWERCIEEYKKHWFEESKNREDLFSKFNEEKIRFNVPKGIDKIKEVFPEAEDVDVYVLIGLYSSNAFQYFLEGRPAVGLPVEAYGTTFFGIPMPYEEIPLWLSHEIGHALRYKNPSHPLAKWIYQNGLKLDKAVEEFPLFEFLIDEGLAVMTTKWFFPEVPLHKVLGYTEDVYHWCVNNEKELMSKLRNIWDKPPGKEEYFRYFSGYGESIPPRTGYYIGMRLIENFIERHPEIDKRDLFTISAEEIVAPSVK